MRFVGRERLGLVAIALVALCAGTPAVASYTVTTVYSFDASGNETLVSYAATSPSGLNCNAGGELCGGPSLATVTNYVALSFNPPTNLSQQITANTTEIIGTLNGGSTVYDLTFQAAFNSPIVQAGLQSAINTIQAAGGSGVTISSPQLVSSTVSTSSTVNTTYTVSGESTSSVVTTAIGVAPISALSALVSSSNYDPISDTLFTTTVLHPELAPAMPNVYTSCTPSLSSTTGTFTPVAVGTVLATAPICAPYNGGIYTLAAGQTDINIAETTTFTIDPTTTTTSTTTTAMVYDINGVTSGSPPIITDPGTSVPEPSSLMLLAVGFGAVSWRRYRKGVVSPADHKPLPA